MANQSTEDSANLSQAEAMPSERESEAEVDHRHLAQLVATSYTPPAALPATRLPAASPKRSLAPLISIIIFLALLGLGGLGAGVYLWSHSATSGPQLEIPNPLQPSPATREMAWVPGGTYKMGRSDVSLSNPELVNQYPAHNVTVASFYMDRTEVTNAEYAEFVRDTGYAPPGHWTQGQPPAGQERWPVTNVSFVDAQAFAAWRTKRDGVQYRLPTEEEWEYAARGGAANLLYPWGGQWREGMANVGTESPQAVGSLPQGASVWGVLDLIGNVWEWTSSMNSIYPGNSAADLTDPNVIITRGGSYASKTSGEGALTATSRRAARPDTKHLSLGFRLVRDGS